MRVKLRSVLLTNRKRQRPMTITYVLRETTPPKTVTLTSERGEIVHVYTYLDGAVEAVWIADSSSAMFDDEDDAVEFLQGEGYSL
jgi:hypothetical protein